MIKRRFYKQDHGDRDNASEPSSSSDSELEVEVEEEEETEEEHDHGVIAEVREKDESSGYESEDSSANQVDEDSSALLTSDADIGTGIDETTNAKVCTPAKSSAETVDPESNPVAEKDSVALADAITDCILKCKSVFKCRLCPRIVCLSEETLKAHLVSKRHARSVKLLIEGRLKLVLDSDGEIEERILEEAHSPIVASGQLNQNTDNSKKKNKGRQRQRKRLMKKKTGGDLNLEKARQSTKKPAKKRHKSEN